VIVVLSTLLGLVGARAFFDSRSVNAASTALDRTVRLTWPSPGFTFGGDYFEGIRGTVTGLHQGDTLWLMVQTVGDDRPYLMSKPCSINNGGHFDCPPAYAGNPGRTRAIRVMVRVFSSSTARQVIADWENARASNKESLSYGAPLGYAGAAVVVVRTA